MRFKPKQIFLLTIYVLFAKETLKILFQQETWSPGRSTLNEHSNKANSESLFPLFENMTSLTTGSESVIKETEPSMGPLCKRKNHVVYIKTHKTGSTTLAHIFWRYALRRNLQVLTLDSRFSFLNGSFINHMLDNHCSLHKLSHFDIAADHMIYNRKEFQQVMPKDTVYVSSLREPVAQFKSAVNYYRIAKRLNITTANPVATILRDLDQYLLAKNSGKLSKLRNRNAWMLGWNSNDVENESEANEFLSRIHREFVHVLVAEYFDESLILMRRKLCWEISDILYLPLLVRKYDYKNHSLETELVNKLTNWSQVDAMLYKRFNETLWKNIAQYGEDFWEELKFYKNQKLRIVRFCLPFVENQKKCCNVSDFEEYLEIPRSPWSAAFKIDIVWCIVSKLDLTIIKNTIRVRQYPELCDNIVPVINYRHFRKSRTIPEVMLHPDHCSPDMTSEGSTFRIPVSVLRKGLC